MPDASRHEADAKSASFIIPIPHTITSIPNPIPSLPNMITPLYDTNFPTFTYHFGNFHDAITSISEHEFPVSEL